MTKIHGLLRQTPLGWLAVAVRDSQLFRATLPARRREQAIEELGIEADFTLPQILLEKLDRDLSRYFAGEPVSFRRYKVDLTDQPPFLRQVLLACRAIPFGQVRSYGWLATQAGRPGAARAAGQAMARNPIPLIIPCHRVIAANGGLGGFGGGLEMKRKLLQLEGVKITVRGVEVDS